MASLRSVMIGLALSAAAAPAAGDSGTSGFVEALGQATVRVVSGDDRSSGVILSETRGLVLTCAHGIHDDGSSEVTLFRNNGAALTARLIAVDRDRDLALLQTPSARSDATGPAIPADLIPLRDEPAQGTVVLAVGFPGREANGHTAVVRLGRVLAGGRSDLRTSCPLTAGDSGGPLFDGRGALVGVHRRIGIGTDSNVHLNAATIADFLQRVDVAPQRQSDRPLRLSAADVTPGARVRERLRTLAVTVFDKAQELARGTVIDDQRVATKLSRLKGVTHVRCLTHDGRTVAASVVRADRASDLAILDLMQPLERPVALAELEPGDLVFTGPRTTAGVVSRVGYAEPELPVTLGLELRLREGGELRVTDTAPQGFAALAGVRPGDRLQRFAGRSIAGFDSLSRAIATVQPGDWVTIEVERHAEQLRLSEALPPDPAARFERTEYLDGRAGRLSGRRSRLAPVIQHDIPIAPEDCGGPLLDSAGRLAGINIARRARESTLALPIRVVQQVASSDTASLP